MCEEPHSILYVPRNFHTIAENLHNIGRYMALIVALPRGLMIEEEEQGTLKKNNGTTFFSNYEWQSIIHEKY